MNANKEQIRAELARLDEADRAELARFLIDSLEPLCGESKEATLDTNLERRRQEIMEGRTKGEPSEKVFEELRSKYA